MNVLISGGFGYIGSYLLHHLLSKDYKIGVISRSIPGYFAELSKKADVYIADISKRLEIELDKDYDLFIHLASANDIDSKDASVAINVNALGAKNCLDFCINNKINKFIYFSTFQVYGYGSGYIDENTPLMYRNDYAISHFFAEEYVKMYSRNYGLDYLILRPTNIFGALSDKNIDRWSLVPNCFCKEAFERGTITLLSSGRQLKDFISLWDLSNITNLLCENFSENKNEIINLASGKSISIRSIAEQVKMVYESLYKKHCDILVLSDSPGSSGDLVVSTDKIKNLKYEYSCEYTLEDEIRKIFRLLEEVENG